MSLHPLLIVISGPPGAGKTTLGRRLASDLRLPFVHKDGIKETLFESLGWEDRAWSRRLGIASYDLLYYVVEVQLAAGRSLLIESNFSPHYDEKRFGDLRARYGFHPIHIFCRAAPAVLQERYRARDASGERHPGHVGRTSYEEIDDEVEPLLRNELYGPLNLGGPVIEIDTSDFATVDYDALLDKIRKACSGRSL